MSFLDCVIVFILDVLLITLAVKTKLYINIIEMLRRNISKIKMLFVIVFPFCVLLLFIFFFNAVFIMSPVEISNIDISKEYSILKDFKQFGKDLIIYSPIFYLVMCFFIQWVHYRNIKIKKKLRIV